MSKRIPRSPPTIPRFFAIFSLCSILFTVASSEREDQPATVLRLPSEIAGDNLCGETTPSKCPSNNCFRTDPVCGDDGVTYWCGCTEAACAGARVVKLGFCEVGSGGSSPLPGQAFLLVHIVWLIVLGFSVLFGLF